MHCERSHQNDSSWESYELFSEKKAFLEYSNNKKSNWLGQSIGNDRLFSFSYS